MTEAVLKFAFCHCYCVCCCIVFLLLDYMPMCVEETTDVPEGVASSRRGCALAKLFGLRWDDTSLL